jgi:ribose transport system ATP-binding protein
MSPVARSPGRSPGLPVGAGDGRPALEITGLAKAFGPTRALRGVSLTVQPGEIRALLGENGSGKSTLIKILSGYHEPDDGEVTVAGARLPTGSPDASASLGLRFVHQNLGLVDSLTVAENLCLSSGYPVRLGTIMERQTRAEAHRDLERVGLSLDPRTQVEDLTPAEKTGLAVARSLRGTGHGEVAVLILDEPTANLPDVEVDRLLQIVRSVAAGGTAVIYVTHRLTEVFAVSHTATVLRDGSEVITARTADLDTAALMHHMLGAEFERIESSIGTAEAHLAEAPLLEVRDLHAARLAGVSFSVRPGEIVGIAGITGSGREQIAGAIFGETDRVSGEVIIDGKQLRKLRPDIAMSLGSAFIPANRERSAGFMELSARENLSLGRISDFWRWPTLRFGQERANARDWFSRLRVSPADRSESSLNSFSGGNQQKIVFAKWLQRAPRVFLLEEPTQGVDVATKAFLHQQLHDAAAERGAAVLVSSSDSEELVSLCHRVLVLADGRVAAELKGPELMASHISYHSLSAAKEATAHEA